ncbi:MAG: helicase-related protein, partial [Hyphomicrobiaceae bacterium]
FNESRATLVFCATREAVKRMHARLMERGFSAVALSGELSQEQRNQALQSLRDGRARVLVATDVAARGLDLPDLALVIHADLPNDSETLLHRSGRTGRAGRKGMCALIVPFSKRRKAETLLNGAKLRVIWSPAPTADEIRAKDQERFLADAVFIDVATEEELALVTSLQSSQTAEAIALALVRMHRASLPTPEDLSEDTGPPPRRDDDRPRSSGYVSRAASGEVREPRERRIRDGFKPRNSDSADKPFERERERAPRSPRQDTRPMVWFRLNIGRERNADPRWLLPLICKAGDVTKTDIGAIKIFDRDTRFEIVADQADRFAEAIQSNKPKEGHISRVGDHTPAEGAPAPATERPPRKEYVPKADAERAPRKAYEPKADAAPRKSYDRAATRTDLPSERADHKTERLEHKPKSDWKPRPKPFEARKSTGHSDGFKARTEPRDNDKDQRAKPFEPRENRDRKPKEDGFAARGSARPAGFVARTPKPGAARPEAKGGAKPFNKFAGKSTYKTKKARQAESSGS